MTADDAFSEWQELDDAPAGPTVSGSTATYQSLKRVFLQGEEDLRPAARSILLRSGVWMPVHLYQHWPVLLPWIVRDNQLAKSAKNAEATGKDQKSTASPVNGLQREDNGAVSGLGQGHPVLWRGGLQSTFKQKGLKKGPAQWMQSHCWSGLAADPATSTARHPLLNSFVPNLVWLPDAIGRLTDEETLIVKDELRSIAWARYRHVRVVPEVEPIVERAWSLLREPQRTGVDERELGLVNEFDLGGHFLELSVTRFERVVTVADKVLDDHSVSDVKLTPTVYRDSLAALPREVVAGLRDHLALFERAVPVARGHAEVLSRATAAATPKTPQKTAGGASEKYTVTTPAGVFTDVPRSRAALLLVRGLMRNGVGPDGLYTVLSKGKLRRVDGIFRGGDLWSALQESGVAGSKSKWFLDDPIHLDGRTYVLDAGVWTNEYAAKTFPKLTLLDPLGDLDYDVLLPKEPPYDD